MTMWPKATDTLNQDGDLIRESWQVCLTFLLQRGIEHLLCSLAEDWKMAQRGSLFSRSSQAGGEGCKCIIIMQGSCCNRDVVTVPEE